jgi:hypothetical protein
MMRIMFLMASSYIEINKVDYPLYLTEINGTLILEQQIAYCRYLEPENYLFCVKADDIRAFNVDSVLRRLVPESVVIPVTGPTKGAICTALLGARHISNDEELVLMAVDDFVEAQGGHILRYFREQKSDAGVVSFTSVHPRYSFARLDEEGNVVEVAEKRPVSKNALASFYYFRHGTDFVECAKEVIRKDNPIHDAFYVSQALNEMILQLKKVSMYKILNETFHPLKTETQLAQYLEEVRGEKAVK